MQARRLFYLGYCNSKLGNQEKSKEYWNEALGLSRLSRFEPIYKYKDMKTKYYQAFCLKGLGKYNEAETYIKLINEFANSNSITKNMDLRSTLLQLSISGYEDIDNVAKWDTEIGLIKNKIHFNAPEE